MKLSTEHELQFRIKDLEYAIARYRFTFNRYYAYVLMGIEFKEASKLESLRKMIYDIMVDIEKLACHKVPYAKNY